MLEKRHLVTLVLLATLVLIGTYSMLTPKANAQQMYMLTLTSRVESASCVNVGTVTIGAGQPPSPLPITKAIVFNIPFQVTANPPAGCSFVRWEPMGPITIQDPNAQTTIFIVTNDIGVRAVFTGTCCARVGGVVQPTDMLAVLAPYLALIGLVTTAGIAVAVKRRRKN